MTAASRTLLIIVAIAALVAGLAVNQPDQQTVKPDSLPYLTTNYPSSLNSSPNSIQDLHKAITIINFWASWCAPCREEMPLLEQTFRSHADKGLTIIGMAIDSPERAQPFLDSMDISYPILYVDDVGMQLLTDSGNQNGLLPYTLVINAKGEVADKKLGLILSEDLDNWLNLL